MFILNWFALESVIIQAYPHIFINKYCNVFKVNGNDAGEGEQF